MSRWRCCTVDWSLIYALLECSWVWINSFLLTTAFIIFILIVRIEVFGSCDYLFLNSINSKMDLTWVFFIFFSFFWMQSINQVEADEFTLKNILYIFAWSVSLGCVGNWILFSGHWSPKFSDIGEILFWCTPNTLHSMHISHLKLHNHRRKQSIFLFAGSLGHDVILFPLEIKRSDSCLLYEVLANSNTL